MSASRSLDSSSVSRTPSSWSSSDVPRIGVNSPPLQFLLYGVCRGARFGNGLSKLICCHAQLLCPVSNFVIFMDVDSAGVLRSSLGFVVGHLGLSGSLPASALP